MTRIRVKQASSRTNPMAVVGWLAVFGGTLKFLLDSHDSYHNSLSGLLNFENSTQQESSLSSSSSVTLQHQQRQSSSNNEENKVSAASEQEKLNALSALASGLSSQKQAASTNYPGVEPKYILEPFEMPTIDGLPLTSETHAHEFRANLDITAEFESTFCLPWDVNGDEWWAHNPLWQAGMENDTHYCFEPITNENRRNLYQALYNTQFHGDCSKTHTKRMWNSGWSADMTNVIDGLEHVVKRKIPVQIVEAKPWHFAYPARKPTKENRHVPPACPRKNMFCYFLPLSKCPAEETGSRSQFLERKFSGTFKYQRYYEYATRRQTWLRKQIYDFTKQQNVQSPCTVIHVRRGDVVLHTGSLQRRYRAIGEYLNATDKLRPNIYLLTDDKNALNEAKIEFPNLNWMYIDRPRYKGAEGGWEKQIPSNDPTYEVTVLLSEFQLARKCDQIIHSRSGFATQLFLEMQASGQTIDRIDLDDDQYRNGPVHSKKHKNTVDISAKYDDEKLAAKSA